MSVACISRQVWLFSVAYALVVAPGALMGSTSKRDPVVIRTNPPSSTAKAVVLFDARTGEIIFKQNETQPRQVASTQKLLTALIIAESGNLEKAVLIKKSDTMEPALKLGLHVGEVYTRRALLTVMLMKSANDVAAALARDNARSVAGFANKMNQRMTRLHGTTSHFVNPNGLPLNTQYSTARDMALVASAVYANPILREIINCRNYRFRFNNGTVKTFRNTNSLLRKYSFCNGMKTGYTREAGHCLIASGKWKGREMIAVILGVPIRSRIWNEAQSLLAYGLRMQPEDISAARLVSTSRKKVSQAFFIYGR